MNTIKSLWLLFALISTCFADVCKQICILDNVNCVTKGGLNVYKKVVNGVKGLLPPLDPLEIDEVDGEMESVKYKLTNITMIGLKNCTVTKLTINVTDNIYKQYIHCPQLISHFHFEAEDNSDTPVLRGKGLATIAAWMSVDNGRTLHPFIKGPEYFIEQVTLFLGMPDYAIFKNRHDYNILNLGDYAVFVNKDHKPHFFIKTHETKSRLKGKLVFSITKVYVVDSHRANETELYMNNNWRTTEDLLHKPIVKRAMDILINNIDVYIRKYTMGEVLPDQNK